MKISKFTKLGILIVFALTCLIWGLSYLKGHDIFKKKIYYHIVYQRIDGLSESNKVLLNGYQIGQVDNIDFMPDKSGNLLVTILVKESMKIPVNSVAQLVSSDIIGTRAIKIILSSEKEVYSSHDTIPGSIESDLKEQVSMQMLPIKSKAEQLLGTIDSAITILTVIFNENARDNLKNSFENIDMTIANLKRTTHDLQQIVSNEKDNIQHVVSNLNEITTTFSENSGNLKKTIANISTFSDSLSQISVTPIINNISKASEQILVLLEKLNSNQNSAGLLLNDKELYLSVNELSENLATLIKDIQRNPKRYLHFSAVDLGKKIYVTENESISKSTVYRIHLLTTGNRISLDSKLFAESGDVQEIENDGMFTYLAGNEKTFNAISEKLSFYLKTFPDAYIVAFKNGKMINIEKALKP